MRTMDRFAEELSKHDAEAGDPGGKVSRVSKALGIEVNYGRALLQRIRNELGDQAR